jgi:hypothetical protein
MIKVIVLTISFVFGISNMVSSSDVINDTDITGEVFPELKAKNLSGEEVILPEVLMGKVTLVLIAFERDAQKILDSWLEPFNMKFKDYEDVDFYEIPMLKRRWKLISRYIDGGMRSGIPQEKHGNVMTYYGDINKYRDILDMRDKSTGYVFLIDKEGKIRWSQSGYADESRLENLFENVIVFLNKGK